MPRCDCCGKFRKKEDVSGMAGESDDVGNCEEWVECIHCMSGIDLERHNYNIQYWKEQNEQTKQS